MRFIPLIKSRLGKIKGKILVLNDYGKNYIDVSKSDLPTISRSQISISEDTNFDELIEKALGGITVSSINHLKEALQNDNKIINIKIDPDFESLILSRI